MKSELTLSIVIPVYNEEHHLKACLDSIAAQSVKPLEVIIVDNNSTDKSADIARSYAFVTLLHEAKQHQVYAQATGFDHSKADVLGRIDADCILPADWSKTVLEQFKDNNLAALTGAADPYDVPLKRLGTAIFDFYHRRLMRLFTGKTMLWNSNAAIRAKYWPTVKKQMLFADNIWEDYEMSYWLADLGEVRDLRSLKVGCSVRSIHKGFFAQLAYQYRGVRVFARHNGRLKTIVFFFAWYTMIPLFLLTMIDRFLLKIRHKEI